MKKNKIFLTVFLTVFIIVELGLGVAIQLTDGTEYKVLSVTSVAVALLGALLFFKNKSTKVIYLFFFY